MSILARKKKMSPNSEEQGLRFRGPSSGSGDDENANGSSSSSNYSSTANSPKKTEKRKRFISESAYQRYGSKSNRCKWKNVRILHFLKENFLTDNFPVRN